MPWGDCTGPDGQGPMTGRGRGFFNNTNNNPNTQNSAPSFWVRLFGRRRGQGWGLGLGFGRRGRRRGPGWGQGRGRANW